MTRDERIAAIRSELSNIHAQVTALFNELDDLEVFSVSSIADTRQLSLSQQVLSALAADRLP